ncbi:hypothetical protein KUTeg_014476 [Tegillarca granosa]|uniref:Uncharacterized protein n=1 Tax=Tegillarca granosa TaxID=220873 RepID=A0ABQ9ERX8_TEGGR|nr:hypothetical protein KUTeg_014476 [Tegillarca granosa]
MSIEQFHVHLLSIIISSSFIINEVSQNDMNASLTLNNSMARTSVSFSNQLDGPKYSPKLQILHTDIIGERFWQEHPEILACSSRK